MSYDEKPEGDPVKLAAALRHSERYLAHTRAAQLLAERLRRMGIWLRGLDTGMHCYGFDGERQVWRNYRAKRIVTMEGKSHDYVASITPGSAL